MAPVLITSAVKPASQRDTALRSESDRHDQCRDALMFLLDQNIFDQYVIVDGSDTKIFSIEEIEQLSKKYHVIIEQLHFHQDYNAVRLNGKSYGELEIIYHAIHNSELIRANGSFTKLSGRYYISNLPKIWKKVGYLENFFFFDNPVRLNFGRAYVCTIIYSTTIDFFMANFAGALDECSYDRHGFLESIFFRRLCNLDKKAVRTPFPFYNGISGVTGQRTVNSKYFFRNILSQSGILCHTFGS